MSDWPEGYEPLNGCTVCGRDFAGTVYFDLHRVGNHEHDFDVGHPEGRRCMDEGELAEAGLVRVRPGDSSRYENRLSSGVRLYWHPERAEQLREVFAKDEEEAA